jgi:hypothetical protein
MVCGSVIGDIGNNGWKTYSRQYTKGKVTKKPENMTLPRKGFHYKQYCNNRDFFVFNMTTNLQLCTAYNLSVGNSEGKKLLERTRRRWVDNIKIEKTAVFCYVMPCRSYKDWRFDGLYRLHNQVLVTLMMETIDSSVTSILISHTVSHPRRRHSS